MFFEIGEKIICVDGSPFVFPDNNTSSLLKKIYSNVKIPVKGKIYTFRGYYITERIGLYVEELVNDTHPITGNEIPYSTKRFSKLQNLTVSKELLKCEIE